MKKDTTFYNLRERGGKALYPNTKGQGGGFSRKGENNRGAMIYTITPEVTFVLFKGSQRQVF